MELHEALFAEGIRPRKHTEGEHRTTCPKCSHTRKKKTDPCLAVKIDGDGGATWLCQHCGWSGNIASERYCYREPTFKRQHAAKPPHARPVPPENPEKPESMFQWFEGRGISQETVDDAGCYLTTQWFPRTEKNERCIAFPYTRDGQLVNHKYRTQAKDFRQDKGAEPILYNVDAVAGTDTAIFVEGEMDVLSMIEAGYPATVSLPTGAPPEGKAETDPDAKRYAALVNCETELAHVTKFVLAGDADGPGRGLMEELARRLGKERCWRVRWPAINDAPCKDANQVLVEHGADVLRECIEAAEPYPIAGLHDAGDFEADVLALYRGERSKGLSTGWPRLDEHMTIRPGDLSIVTGIPNHGKSEFVDALMVNMARLHGWGFAVCSFENGPDEHIAKLAEKYAHAPFWKGPTHRMDEASLRGAMGWVREHFMFIRADDEAPTVGWILEKARAAVLRHGVRGLVIDPFNEVEANRPSGMTETEYVSQILGKVRRFAQSNDVHVWFVAHPQKLRRDSAGGPVPVPTLYDISGSAHWANKSDFGITVHRPDETRPITEIYIRKVRRKWLGKRGVVSLSYSPATGEYGDAA